MKKPVDDLELYEILNKIYPQHFGDNDEDYQKALAFLENINELCKQFDDTSFFKLDEFIEKLVYLAPVLHSELTQKAYHALGETTKDGSFYAFIKREYQPQNGD